MNGKLQPLPIGIQSFDLLRRQGNLYVDKTAKLMRLVEESTRVFLSRPRRFGKSLTLSTLGAMFGGQAELFKGLAAEGWVAEQAKCPSPVLRLDMSTMDTRDVPCFEKNLIAELTNLARKCGVTLDRIDADEPGGALKGLVEGLYEQGGPVVVLIDEYDKPILDKIGEPAAADAMRMALRTFYTVIKGCDEYLRFVMLTGISVWPKCPTLRPDTADQHDAGRLNGARESAAWPKFTKTGVFSAMNNLNDISMNKRYGDIVGYTQAELERDFSGWIDRTAVELGTGREELLQRMKAYYDGFCFDGTTRLYNPFSVLRFLSEGAFANYWYSSGSPSFIAAYMKGHAIRDPEAYRGLVVSASFAESQEIERAKPESFLYQSGYLTIAKREEQALTLDYPNREVLDSISRMYLETIYPVEGYVSLGSELWRGLKEGNLPEVVRLYNAALAGIPYEDFSRQTESLYRSLFLMLLRGAGVTANGEVHTHLGRSDVMVRFPGRVVVLEFKLARSAGEADRLRGEGQRQMEEKGYAKPYDAEGRAVTSAVIVIDAGKRQASLEAESAE